jgi:hypothetical protein
MTPAGEGRSNQPSAAEFPVDFADFVHALNANGVEYLLVGGYAVGVHGYVRATVDIDFFYRRTVATVRAMQTHGLGGGGTNDQQVQIPRAPAAIAYGKYRLRTRVARQVHLELIRPHRLEEFDALRIGLAGPVQIQQQRAIKGLTGHDAGIQRLPLAGRCELVRDDRPIDARDGIVRIPASVLEKTRHWRFL